MMRRPTMVALFAAALATLAAPLAAAHLPHAEPAEAAMCGRQLERIDALVEQAIADGQMPGCVVLIARRGQVVWLRASGDRQVEPERSAMTTDTLFDLASLTKPIATAASVLQLAERGQLRLEDPVSRHVPEFAGPGKEQITVLDLLTHQSGLAPANPLSDFDEGPERALLRMAAAELRAEPRTAFIYSDVGFITLGELVRRLSGLDLHRYTQEHVFRPLGMADTGFLPDSDRRARAAPTERRDGRWLQGEVHDPRADRLGGVAGHAGLFSTAEDLAVYAQMLLDGGQHRGRRVFEPKTVERLTRGHEVPGGRRGLGWDSRSSYSSNRSPRYSERAFGHGGFTGTALWVDPQLELVVVLLSSRLHPNGRGSVNRLAAEIGTVAADAVLDHSDAGVRTGIDVLRREDFRRLQGRRVGLITNHTGVARDGTSTVELFYEADQLQLVALFSPEHGLEGTYDTFVQDSQHRETGLKVHSLYGDVRRPTAESLEELDTLVFDIQDIGTRFYTYVSTMGEAMMAAAEHGKRMVVLDRPNPIGGVEVGGPMLDPGRESFVAFHRLPIRHGMTVGELARMFRDELELELELEVVPVEGWSRGWYFDETHLWWVNPSPNMRRLSQALLYPGIGLLETTNVSVGRGTDTPFELIGAPWIDGRRLAAALNGADLEGVRFVPRRFTPAASTFAGELCEGVDIWISDRDRLDPLLVGLEIAHQLQRLHGDAWAIDRYDRLLRSRETLDRIRRGDPGRAVHASHAADVQQFLERRRPYLLYEEHRRRAGSR